MKKQKTSVLFISNDGRTRKPVQVPTSLILYWRRYLLGAFVIIAMLGSLAGLLIYQQTSSYYTRKLTLVERMKMNTDISKVQHSFEHINKYIDRVNNLLHTKELPAIPRDTVYRNTPQVTFDNINDATDEFIDALRKLEHTINSCPIGRPHKGTITSTFGNRSNPFSGSGAEQHKGIDFRGKTGEAIRTTAAGKVAFAGVRGGYGNCVIVAHQNGLHTLYGHMSAICTRVGASVSSGDVVGRLGSTGRSTGPHLHYEIHRNGERIDPYEYLTIP